jgi:cytochrome c-type biogenesis protein
MTLTELLNSFLIGLATPLTAVCVIPLYPGFISYLSKQFEGEESRSTYALFGSIVVLGVITFMLLTGLIFSTLIQASLTNVIETVSPIAFGILGLMSIAMILNLDFQKFIPSGDRSPEFENPLLNAFSFGFFFGAIILPCNPAFIATFLARAFLFETPITSLLNFSLFGLGIGAPLMIFSIISSAKSQKVIKILQKHENLIHRGSGLIMLGISLYYLVFVFQITP